MSHAVTATEGVTVRVSVAFDEPYPIPVDRREGGRKAAIDAFGLNVTVMPDGKTVPQYIRTTGKQINSDGRPGQRVLQVYPRMSDLPEGMEDEIRRAARLQAAVVGEAVS